MNFLTSFYFFLFLTECPASGQTIVNGACVCPADQVLNGAGDTCEGNGH